MNKKNILKIALLIIIFLLLFLIIQSTYSKYLSKKDSNSNLLLSSWNIKINDKNILNNDDITANIKPVFEQDPNVSNNFLAPGSKGYFEITIDSTGTELPYRYDITINKNANQIYQNIVPDFRITSYSINDGTINNIDNYDFDISEKIHPPVKPDGTIDLTKSQTIKIKFFVEWKDTPQDQTALNNIEDVEVSKNNNPIANIPLLFQITQLPPAQY